MNTNRNQRRNEPAIVRLYQVLLFCFPAEYRREYADELLYAVRMAAVDAQAQGRVSLLRLAWRELHDLPLAVVRAHWRRWRKSMKLQPGGYLPGGPVRGWQLGALFLPFLVPLLLLLPSWTYTNAAMWLAGALGLLLVGLLIAVWIAGLVREFPLWALPALGVVLFLVSAVLHRLAQFGFYALMGSISGSRGWPDGLSFAQNVWWSLGIQLLYLVITTGLIAGLLRIVPSFHQRVRQEWTLLSFLLYGIAIAPVIGNDAFRGVEGYEIASLLILMIGAGLYLTVPRRWQRVLALVVAAILSPLVMGLGLYLAFPAQEWASWVGDSYRMWEAIQPVLYLAPLPILLLLAALAPRLPVSAERTPAA